MQIMFVFKAKALTFLKEIDFRKLNLALGWQYNFSKKFLKDIFQKLRTVLELFKKCFPFIICFSYFEYDCC